MTLQQIIEEFLLLMRENSTTPESSHFAQPEIRGFANGAQNFLTALSVSTKDDVTIAIDVGTGAYTLLSDTVLLKQAYYGNIAQVGGVKPLKITTEKILTSLRPGWREETTDSRGEPSYLIKLDPKTIFIHPIPNSDQAGKRIILSYAYMPSPMVNNSDEPDVPLVFHPILKFYMGFLGYINLSNPAMKNEMYADFIRQYNLLKDTVDRETEETFSWKWG